jgi:tRNA A37 threonylcarbamoyltransferase TsaD
MRAIFDPVVKEIIRLVEQQVKDSKAKKNAVINASVSFNYVEHELTSGKRIILVGGFGDSPYLNRELTNWCKDNGSIQLVCPDHP